VNVSDDLINVFIYMCVCVCVMISDAIKFIHEITFRIIFTVSS